MESINKIDYKLANVPTRAVILFPGRAQVFRDIKDIQLKPGINEVTISGLSPTLDEDSVKVEGAGSAVITDISVESLPNRDSFQDAYPEQDSSDSDQSEDDSDPAPEALRAAQQHLTALQDEARLVADAIDSVNKRQQILDARSDAADTTEQDKGARLAELLAAYRTERAALGRERQAAVQTRRDVRERLDAAAARVQALQKAARRESKERRGARRRRQESARRRRADRREEKERVRRERVKFWPKYCYAVKITLEVGGVTPQSSRRQSVASETDLVRPVNDDDADPTACSLCVSYVTAAAQWTPSYDLQLSTTGASATLCFDAKVSNQTSETWRNCRVSLSTSDAALAGVDAPLPELTPWRIRLAGKSHVLSRGDEDRITRSRVETQECRAFALAQRRRGADTKPREDMFGLDAPPRVQMDMECLSLDLDLDAQGLEDDEGPAPAVQFARREAPEAKKTKQQSESRMRSAVMPMAAFSAAAPPPPPGGRGGGGGFGAAASPPVVDFEDSLIEEAGMSTSYDLPGLKTLAPKSTPSKQRVARITFPHVTLNHSVVAKYRPVAHLQARLPNHSKLTLLPGPAGLTLDGSFLGRTALPRCSPGDVCTLNLGVDPAVKVSYAKPDVRRATTGLFSKESSEVFARAVVLHNTRAAAAVRLTVRDQVPVSEDERLRVDVVTPRGLVVDGPAVVAGAPGREEESRDRDWGRAAAQLGKSGEVSWDVRLNAGKMVKLWLEYAVSAPSGDVAVEC